MEPWLKEKENAGQQNAILIKIRFTTILVRGDLINCECGGFRFNTLRIMGKKVYFSLFGYVNLDGGGKI